MKEYHIQTTPGGQQIACVSPYDEAHYFWAKSQDGVHWEFYCDGKRYPELAEVAPAEEIIRTLRDLNMNISPVMRRI